MVDGKDLVAGTLHDLFHVGFGDVFLHTSLVVQMEPFLVTAAVVVVGGEDAERDTL